MNHYRRILIEREEASELILLSVISFAATVVLVRLFLELTGYPQVGNGTLHIAHLLWGGLAMFVGLIIILIWDNPGVRYTTAVLSGVGVGLFIDELGKFITKSNDYFFPAAAPIIYAVFLLTVIIFLLVRRRNRQDSRRAMVLSLEKLKDVLYGEIDELEGKRILANLTIAKKSDNPDIVELADLLYDHLAAGRLTFADYHPGFFKRISNTLQRWGQKLGRKWHRRLIILALAINGIASLGAILLFLILLLAPDSFNAGQQLVVTLVNAAREADAGGVVGQVLRSALNALIGLVAIAAIILLWRKKERAGMNLGLIQVVLSLTILQMLTFYLTQFTAVIPTIFQFFMLGFILTYQRWYLEDESV